MQRLVLLIVLLLSLMIPSLAQDEMDDLPDLVLAMRQGFHPEGIVWDAEGERFLVGSLTEGTIFEVADDGTVNAFIEDEDLSSSIGLHIDTANNRLLVANADAGVFAGGMGMAMLGVYDLETGERQLMVDMGALMPDVPHFANDLTVDDEGNVYVTDSTVSVVYVVDIEGNADIFAQDERFVNQNFGLNGIDFHTDGYLIVAVAGAGELYKVPLGDDGEITQVMTEEPFGVDGMIFDEDNNLIAVATTFGEAGPMSELLWIASEDGWETATIVNRAELDGSLSPTTVALRDGVAYVVNAHFDTMGMNTTEEFEIIRVDFDEME